MDVNLFRKKTKRGFNLKDLTMNTFSPSLGPFGIFISVHQVCKYVDHKVLVVHLCQ